MSEKLINLGLAPLDIRLVVDEQLTKFISNRINDKSLTLDSIIDIKLGDKTCKFIVVYANPESGIVSLDTKIKIFNEPPEKETKNNFKLEILSIKNNENIILGEKDYILKTEVLQMDKNQYPKKIVLYIMRYNYSLYDGFKKDKYVEFLKR